MGIKSVEYQIVNNPHIGFTIDNHLIKDIKKQYSIAKLGIDGLLAENLKDFMHNACVLVAESLGTEMVKVLKLNDNQTFLDLIVGVGWKPNIVGNARVGVDFSSQAGYTLLKQEPIIVQDFKLEKRFRSPTLLRDHEVQSGMSITIPGKERAYGILGVHSTEKLNYTKDDINFLHSAGNILSATIMLFDKLTK